MSFQRLDGLVLLARDRGNAPQKALPNHPFHHVRDGDFIGTVGRSQPCLQFGSRLEFGLPIQVNR